MSSVSGQITSATLTLPNTSCGASSNAAAGSVVNVWDVTTPADQFGPTPPNPALYGDLGSGTNYGSATTTVTNQPDVVVTFGAAGLAALQTGEGQSGFFVGLSMAGTPNQQIFAQSTIAKGCIPRLAVTVADVVDTPMVNGWVTGGLVAVALLALAAVLLRRRHAARGAA